MKTTYLLLAVAWCAAAQTPARDISGTWVAKSQNPMMGEMEFVYEIRMAPDGKITGAQKMPFGDSPILDGRIAGDTFELTVQTESFGTLENRTVKGTIEGETLKITPAMPMRRPGSGPGGPGGPPAGAAPGGPGGPPPGMGPGGPGGPGRLAPAELVFRRGTPTPSYRAPSVNYATLPKVALPAIQDVPHNGLAKTPPMGWNSWNKFRTRFSDKVVREIADAMVANGMKAAGYQYINIDDGWQWKRDEQGVLLANPNFPDIMALADYVHLKGLKLGIYSSPGPRTCAGHEGSYGHEEQDAKTWAAWGIDYLKYDWCSASRVWKDDDMRAAYQAMGMALAATGRPIVYSLCQYGRAKVGEWGPKVSGNLWRTTGDIRDQWQSMATIGFSQSDLAQYAAPGHWNDPDMLEVGNGAMTPTEYRTHFSLWAMLAAPLIAGNDLRSMTPEIKDILLNKEVIAIDQDSLGQAGRRVTKDGDTEVWTRPLAGGAWAVALFNRGAAEAPVSIRWADLDNKKRRQVRNLWAHADTAATAEGISATVPSHGVVMVRVAK